MSPRPPPHPPTPQELPLMKNCTVHSIRVCSNHSSVCTCSGLARHRRRSTNEVLKWTKIKTFVTQEKKEVLWCNLFLSNQGNTRTKHHSGEFSPQDDAGFDWRGWPPFRVLRQIIIIIKEGLLSLPYNRFLGTELLLTTCIPHFFLLTPTYKQALQAVCCTPTCSAECPQRFTSSQKIGLGIRSPAPKSPVSQNEPQS